MTKITENLRSLPRKSSEEPEPVRESKTLIEEAYNKIKQMIFQQALVSGQRLIYRDLSKILNMSRTPIINALNRLEQEGFVVSHSNRGFNVKPIDPQEAWDLFGAREALEAYTVEQAIHQAGGGDIEILEEKLKNHGQYMPIHYDEKKAVLDAEFHLQIAKMAKNRVIEKMLKINFEHIYLRFSMNKVDLKRMPLAIIEHYKLIESIKNKDVLGSVEIVRIHVRNARNVIVAGISKKNKAIYL
jgi:DNA-binding GntR family transcriptional regulator